MKKRILVRFVLSLGILSWMVGESWGQCTDNITVTNWCENQYASWEVSSPTPGAQYRWFEKNTPIDPLTGYPSTGNDYGYATTFYSPFRVTTAGISPATSVQYYYVKETPSTAVTNTVNSDYGTQGSSTSFGMQFSTTSTIKLNSIDVPVKLYDPNTLYKIQVNITGPAGFNLGSTVYTYKVADATSISGQNYLLTVPVDIPPLLTVGNYTVTINTSPTLTGSTATATPALIYSNSDIINQSNAGLTVTKSNDTQNSHYSVLYNWNYTAICPPKSGGLASKTTTPGACCIPLSNLLSVTSPTNTIVSNTGSVLLTSGTINSTNDYFYWYLDGNFLSTVSGQGKTTLTATQAGNYQVREVINSADEDNPSCYVTASTSLDEKKLFASIKKSPTGPTYCLGDQFTLQATGSASNISWLPSNHLSSATSSTPVFTATSTGDVEFTVSGDVITDDKIVNGDFESGIGPSTSELQTATDPGGANGSYTIKTSVPAQDNATGNNSYWKSCTGSGNFMIINGFDQNTKDVIWSQNVPSITSGKSYTLTFDITNISRNSYYGDVNAMADKDIELQVYINGNPVGPVIGNNAISPITNLCNWSTQKIPWTAGSSESTAKIEIRQVGLFQGLGLDFGLDNIHFGGFSTQTDKVKVGPITDCSSLTAAAGTCKGDSIQLTATLVGGLTFDHWENPSGTNIGTKNPIMIQSLTAGTYTAFANLAVGNVLQNGDFESGNTGFISSVSPATTYYTYSASLGGGGNNNYTVTNNSSAGNSSWLTLPLLPGSTQLFVADAKGPINQKIIAWTFTANTGDKFLFSGEVANQHNKVVPDPSYTVTPAHIGIDINGTSLIDISTPKDNAWHQYKTSWTAPSTGTFTLTLKDLNGTTDPGNDFALDNFILAPQIGSTKSYPVNVPACFTCNKPTLVSITKTDTSRCLGDTLTLHGAYINGGKSVTNTDMYYVWYKKGSAPTATNYKKLTNPSPTGSVLQYPTGSDPIAAPTPAKLITTQAGVYYLRVQDGNIPGQTSCYTEDSVGVIVEPPPTFTMKPATVCGGQVKLDTLVSSILPANYSSLKFYAAADTASGTPLASSTLSTSGTYYARVTGPIPNSCTSAPYKYGAVKVTINTVPGKPTFTGDSALCLGKALKLTATSTDATLRKFFWTFPSGTVAPRADTVSGSGHLNDILQKTAVAATDSGVYKVVAVNAGGCKDSSRVDLHVRPIPDKPVVTDTATAMCEGDTRQLSVPTNTSSTYAWTATNSSPTTGTTDKFTVTAGTSDISLTVKETNKYGCPGLLGTGTVKVYAKPATPDAGKDSSICTPVYNLGAKALATGKGRGKWTVKNSSVPPAPAIAFSDDTLATAKVSNIPEGTPGNPVVVTLTWTVTNGTCPAVHDDVTITRFGKITGPDAGADTTICLGGSVNLYGKSSASSGNGEHQKWEDPNLDSVSNQRIFAVGPFNTAGSFVYNYVISNAVCGESKDPMTVTVVDSAHALITVPVPVSSPGTGQYTFNKNPQAVTATAAPGGYNGSWSVSKGPTSVGQVILGSPPTTAANAVDSMHFDDVDTVKWTVRDVGAFCPAAVAKVVLTRKNITDALAKNDTVCVSIGHYTQVPVNTPNTTLGESGGWTAVAGSPTPPTPASGTTLDVTFTVAGAYTYTYTILNNTIKVGGVPISSHHDYTIIVDDLATQANADSTTLPPHSTGTQICKTPFGLKANAPNRSKGERGGWEGAGVSFLPDTSLATASISGLTDGQSYPLTWSIYTKYGKCAKSSDPITYTKLQDLTPPEVAPVPDFCVGNALNLSANTPANAGEKGVWSSQPPDIMPIADTNTAVPPAITGLKSGIVYKFTWKIYSSVCKGGADSTVTFKVDSIPTVAGITAVGPDCELGTLANTGIGTFAATGVSPTFAFPVHLKWTTRTKSAGGPTRTFTSSDTISPTTVTFASDPNYKQSQDSATVVLAVSNTCGVDSISHAVIYQLRPRVVDTINTGDICGAATGYYAFGTAVQANADTYTWTFGGNPLTDAQYPGTPATDSVHIGPSDWTGLASPETLKVALSNKCGIGVDTFIVVRIITPAKLWVTPGSDKTGNMFCEPQDAVVFTATLGVNQPLTVTGKYTFYGTSIAPGNIITDTRTLPAQFTAAQGSLNQSTGYTVFMAFEADPGQCIANPDPDTSITMDLYDYPDSTVVALGDTVVCDDDPAGVTLMVPSGTKNNNGITWYKDNVLQPQFTDQYTLPTLHSPSESGEYRAQVNSKVCVHVGRDSARVRIYDRPDPSFTGPDPLLVFYSADSVPMPFGSTGTIDTVKGVEYTGDSYNWLNRKDTLYPIIKTTKDEVEVTYTVTMSTGPEGIGCRNQASITIRNTLPLLIPNAFSPNGDGKNETWVIDGLGRYPQSKVKVYDRWGNSLYTDNYGYKTPWDGTHNGALLATGTYYYVIELKGSPDGKDELQTGSLTIVK